MPAEKTKFRVLCFIPAKNCQLSLTGVLSNFSDEVLSYLDEILVVDNGSSDKTVQVAREELKKFSGIKCTVLQNSRNYGLGGSHKIAFMYAFENDFDYVMVLHGDGSVNVQEALPVLRNHNYLKYEMALSSRIMAGAKSSNYAWYRLFFNQLLSLFATLLTGRGVGDFTGGALNFYRTSSFINKFENPIKRYSNDVSFPQYLLLYGIFRRFRIKFFPVNHSEKDFKPAAKLVTQFGKAAVLILKFFFLPRKTIDFDVYGTFFGHNFRRIKISEGDSASEDINSLDEMKTPVTLTELPREMKSEEISPVSSAAEAPETPVTPVQKTEVFQLMDLRKLKIPDLYHKSYDSLNLDIVESVEHLDDSQLWVKAKFDVELITSDGLRAAFLRLFKVFSPENITLDINADRVLRSKQLYEFLNFTKDFGLNSHLVSMNPGNPLMWEKYYPLLKRLTLNYEYGSSSREDFFKLATRLASSSQHPHLHVNVLGHSSKFYYCYRLYELLGKFGIAESVRLQPYLTPSSVEKPQDHMDILQREFEAKKVSPVGSDFRVHYGLPPESNMAQIQEFNLGKEYGFTTISRKAGSAIREMQIDHKGNIFSLSSGEMSNIGNVFDESTPWLKKLSESGEKVL